MARAASTYRSNWRPDVVKGRGRNRREYWNEVLRNYDEAVEENKKFDESVSLKEGTVEEVQVKKPRKPRAKKVLEVA